MDTLTNIDRHIEYVEKEKQNNPEKYSYTLEVLKQIREVYLKENKKLNHELEGMKIDFSKYSSHHPDCHISQYPLSNTKCTCGLWDTKTYNKL